MKKTLTFFLLSAILFLAATKFSGAQTSTITTGSISGSSFCAGSLVSVPFTTTGSFNTGNIFTAELSDASGSFASPVLIGSGTSSPISITIPANAPSGTGYRILVTSSNPAVTGTDNGVDLTINAVSAGTITASTDTVCLGSFVTLTLTGSTGSLQWQITDSTGRYFYDATGATSGSYIDSDTYQVSSFRVIASNGNCIDTSTVFKLNVKQPVQIWGGVVGEVNVCTGASLDYSVSNALYATSYLWSVPPGWTIDAGQGTTSISVTSSSTVDTGNIIVVATNSCGSQSQYTQVTTSFSLVPSIQISVDSSGDTIIICEGYSQEFYATAVNGGASPVFQWKRNGIDIGYNSGVLNTDSLSDGDIITCELTSSFSCVTSPTVESNPITVKVVNLVAELDSIYGNTSVTGGSIQTYYVDSLPNTFYEYWVSVGNQYVYSGNGSRISFKVVANCIVTFQAFTQCSSAIKSISVIPGPCNAYFYMFPDSFAAHYWYAVNLASGVPPITYTWAWGDGDTSTGATPSHAYANPGMYDICLTITDSVGCTSTYCDSNQVYRTEGSQPITVQVILPGTPANIQAPPSAGVAGITVFPNPTNSDVTITTTGAESIEEIIVTNMLGQEVYHLIVTDNKNVTVPLPYTVGIYLVHVVGEKGNYLSKVMKD